MAAYVNLHAGVGKPLWEITLGEFSVWYQVGNIHLLPIQDALHNYKNINRLIVGEKKGIVGSSWIYPAMTASIRTSILLLYRRTFAAQTPYMKFAIWILLVLQGIYLVVFSIMPAFICHPINRAWTALLERHEYCNDWYYYYMSVALYSSSMAFDGILLFIPIYPIMKLHLPLRQRLGIVVIFMLGAG